MSNSYKNKRPAGGGSGAGTRMQDTAAASAQQYTPKSALCQAALSYAARGWHVLPLKPKDKTPLTRNGVKDATTDPQTIRDWWTRWPNANIGIACGPSRLLVIDLDGPEALTAWADLAQRHNINYNTLTAHTGGGGMHIFYRVPDRVHIGNSTGRLGNHIDTRGDGGYIVAPPSVHPSGGLYIWEDPDREILELPQPLADLLTRPKPEAPPPSPPTARRDLHPYAEAALREEAENVRRAPVGTRNDTLNKAAFSLGQLVGAGILDRRTVEEELTAAALTAGLEEREIAATLRSGLEAGMRQPRRLPERNGNLQELISQVAQLDGDLRDAAFEQELLPRLAELSTLTRDWYIRQAAAALGVQETTVRRLVTSHLDGANRYTVQDGCICAVRDGLARPLCNFTAEITEDVARDDGETFSRYFSITGRLADGTNLPTIRVESDRFDKMTWVSTLWGARAIVRAGPQVRDQLREAIHLLSRNITVHRIYTHTGWRVIDGKRAYLTAAGALGLDGVTVELDPDLERYRLPPKPEDPAGAMRASLRFLEIGPEAVTVPVWAAVYLAPLSEIVHPGFILWLYGMSGTFKSTLATLALSHYGNFRSETDADRSKLPQWDSTANYLIRLSFLLKDCLMVIDDFRPVSNPRKSRDMESTADQVIRAVSNQASRGRLNSNLSVRPTFYPRGMILSTGEMVPPGLSTTARVFTVEVRKDTIDTERLTAAQAEAAAYPHALAGYILWLADRWDDLAQTLPQRRYDFRAHILKNHTGHRRVPENLATLYLALDLALTYAAEIGALTNREAKDWRERGWEALWGVAENQTGRIDRERPTLIFLEVLSTLITQGKARLYHKESDREFAPDPGAEIVGWYDDSSIYLIPEAAYHTVARFLREEGKQFPVNEDALRKYLAEEGYLQKYTEGHYTWQMRRGEKRYRVLQLSREKVADYFPIGTGPLEMP